VWPHTALVSFVVAPGVSRRVARPGCLSRIYMLTCWPQRNSSDLVEIVTRINIPCAQISVDGSVRTSSWPNQESRTQLPFPSEHAQSSKCQQ